MKIVEEPAAAAAAAAVSPAAAPTVTVTTTTTRDADSMAAQIDARHEENYAREPDGYHANRFCPVHPARHALCAYTAFFKGDGCFECWLWAHRVALPPSYLK